MKALVEGGEVVEALRERMLGRELAADLVHPETQDVLFDGVRCSTRTRSRQSTTWASTRSRCARALSCDTRWGVCAKCYGRDLGRGSLVNVGEAIGVIAAQSIGEPGTQLTMRTFHIGGAASRTAVQSHVEAKSAGTVRFTATMRYRDERQGRQGGHLALGRSHDRRRQQPRARAPQGAVRRDAAGRRRRHGASAGKMLANWDPHHRPIITEYAGTVQLRARGGRRDRRQADRRRHRPVDPGGHRSQAARHGREQGPAPVGQADQRSRRRSAHRRAPTTP